MVLHCQQVYQSAGRTDRLPMSIRQAGAGDITQYDTFRIELDPDGSPGITSEELTVEAQRDRNIHDITLSISVIQWAQAAPNGYGVDGAVSMALGQSSPVAAENEYRTGVRMPVQHRFETQRFMQGEDSIGFAYGFGTQQFLNDPNIQFLWQQGETLFISGVLVQMTGPVAVPVRIDGVVSYDEL